MDWNTLLAVVVGGLIATVPTIINNIYQERQRKEDRKEQRREAKILATEKRVEKDIDVIQDAINSVLEYAGLYIRIDKVYTDIKDKEMWGQVGPKEADKVYEVETETINELTRTLKRKHTLAQGIAYSYNGIVGYWEAYDKSTRELLEYVEKNPLTSTDKSKAWKNFMESTGSLQKVIRYELISIRDSK